MLNPLTHSFVQQPLLTMDCLGGLVWGSKDIAVSEEWTVL